MPDSSVVWDLRNRRGLIYELLEDVRQWRERHVCELILRDSDHVASRSSYQLRLPLDLIRRFQPEAREGDSVRLVLPLTVRAKQLLLGLDLAGPGGSPSFLVLREEAALIQGEYLMRLVRGETTWEEDLGPRTLSVLEELFIGISACTVDEWRHHRDLHHDRVDALTAYLNADATWDDQGGQQREWTATRSDVQRWLSALEPARQLLVDALDEGCDESSASECILLAIPFMQVGAHSVEAVDVLVDDFADAVVLMSSEARQVLAEYGRRWEVMVEIVLPVERPCKVTLCEQRPWLKSPSPFMEQVVPFGDARTTHVEVRAPDQAVVLDDWAIHDQSGHLYGIGVADSVRYTPDALSIYAADPERPYLATVRVRVNVRREQRLLIGALALMVLVAAVGVMLLPSDRESFVEALSLLTFPLTLAGAVVLSRESSPLADRLLARGRICLGAAIVALWVLTTYRLVRHEW